MADESVTKGSIARNIVAGLRRKEREEYWRWRRAAQQLESEITKSKRNKKLLLIAIEFERRCWGSNMDAHNSAAFAKAVLRGELK